VLEFDMRGGYHLERKVFLGRQGLEPRDPRSQLLGQREPLLKDYLL